MIYLKVQGVHGIIIFRLASKIRTWKREMDNSKIGKHLYKRELKFQMITFQLNFLNNFIKLLPLPNK